MDNYFLYYELIPIFQNLINEARKSPRGQTYRKLNNYVNQLEKLNNTNKIDTFNNDNLQNALKQLKQIQKISLEIRNLLPDFLGLQHDYKTIDTVFYIEGKRYETKKIKVDWLQPNTSGTEIRIKLSKVYESLSKQIKQNKQQIFLKHYNLYLAAISGMYEKVNKKQLGKDRINKGHVAEAYERFLQIKYKELLNSNELNSNQETLLAKMDKVTYWEQEESLEEAWVHIRDSLGRTRGTTYGDVNNIQVKQGKIDAGRSGHEDEVRLVSLANLKEGIKNYSLIFNTDVDSLSLAKKLANYMTSSVGKEVDKAIRKTMDEGTKKILKEELGIKRKHLGVTFGG